MEFAEFYYDKNENIAKARGSLPGGEFYLYSVSFPMLAKTISDDGDFSPNGDNTRDVTVRRDQDTPITLNIPEGFHNTSELVTAFNAAFLKSVGNTELEMVSYGSSQMYLRNNSANNDWQVNLLNRSLSLLFIGSDLPGITTITVNRGQKSINFTPDPFFGNFSMELKIQNNASIFLPATGGYLEGGTLYFPEKIKVNFDNVNVVEMYANYPSLNVVKKLHAPYPYVIRLGYKRV